MSRPLDLDAPRTLLERAPVARLLAALDAPDEETRIVGGAVRNALIGRPVVEIDLATTALPNATMARARAAGLKAVPTGIDHGTVTVVVDGEPYEVTTLREDVETDGRHARVRFGRDFAADAERRDFTVNALSIGRDGRLHDHTGGLDDLGAGRVRFIGDAATRIREDYLRILRFFRFSAEYADGPLDARGFEAAVRERDGLDRLSRERVRAELLKLLASARAPEVVAELEGAGLLARLTGGVGETGRFGRAALAGLDPIDRLGALLVRTGPDADGLRDRLRLSNAETERLRTYAGLLVRILTVEVVDRAEARRLAVLFGVPALEAALAATAGEPRPVVAPDGQEQLSAFARGAPVPIFPLRGADLIRAGVTAGPEVGDALAAARRRWLEAGCPDDAEPASAVV